VKTNTWQPPAKYLTKTFVTLIKTIYMLSCAPEHPQSWNRASFGSPNPARARQLFLKPDLDPKDKLTEWVKICATAGYWWRSQVNMTNNSQLIIFYWR